VVVTKVFEINAIKDLRERKLSVGDDVHTIFFKYEICNIDDSGTIVNSVSVYVDFATGPLSRLSFSHFARKSRKNVSNGYRSEKRIKTGYR